MLQNSSPQLDPLHSLYDFVVAGGPVMWPLGLCSVIALTYIFERSLNLSKTKLGARALGEQILDKVRTSGAGSALEWCSSQRSALARVFSAGLKRAGAPIAEVEKAVEDAGSREVKKLNANLRPLSVVITIAPLLGLLGTVWGMVVAFVQIAAADGLGKPEQLADGISQALITTVAGLVIAIPTQAAYYWFKGRIDRWAREAEELFDRLAEQLRAGGAVHAHS